MPPPIRVAIVGGGISGCTLANGLLHHPNVAFDVFERKSSFVERGATVGLRANATNALRAMGLDVQEMYRNTGAVESDASRCLIAIGEHKGKPIIELPAGHINVVRTRWLEELLKTLPRERLHANKRLNSIDEGNGATSKYKLQFDDGTCYDADAVIGCDGIHSFLRQQILGKEHPHLVSPVFGGYWDARGKTTPEVAAKRFGRELFDPTKSDEIALTGDGAFMLFCPSDDNARYGVIVSAAATDDYDRTAWKTDLDRDFLTKAYQNWEPGFREAVIDVLFAEDSGAETVFSQWQTPETPYYNQKGLCIIGDAAHSMAPFMGYGAGMAIEDCAVMAALLGAVPSSADVDEALNVFNLARHDRNEDLVKQSRVAAKLMTGQLGLDPAQIATLEPSKWWTDIMEIDMERHIQDALALFHAHRQQRID